MTQQKKKANFRGHYFSHETKFRGHLKKSRAKSPFFEGQGKPCFGLIFIQLIKCKLLKSSLYDSGFLVTPFSQMLEFYTKKSLYHVYGFLEYHSGTLYLELSSEIPA